MKRIIAIIGAIAALHISASAQGRLAVFTGLPGVAVTNIDTRVNADRLLGGGSTRGRIKEIILTNGLSISGGVLSPTLGASDTLTDGGTNTLFTLALDANTMAGLEFVSTVTAGNGTNYQSRLARVSVEAVNKAGVITTTLTQTGSTNGASSSGLLATTYYAVTNTSSVFIRVAADSELVSPTLTAHWTILSVVPTGSGAITP